MSEENKALARRSWETVDNPESFNEVYAPDVVWHNPDQDIQGIEEAKQFMAMFQTAFPDMHATVEDVIAEGEQVVTRVTLRGTHQGETELFGPPTDRQVEGQGITIHRIEGGKIVEEWNSWESLSLMQQPGCSRTAVAGPTVSYLPGRGLLPASALSLALIHQCVE